MTTLVVESCVNSLIIQKGLQIQFMDNGEAQKPKHKVLARFHQVDVAAKQQLTETWVEL